MGASAVVVLEPLGKDALEVVAVPDQDPVQTLAPSRTDLPLHVGIGVGRQLQTISTIRGGFESSIHSIR